MTSWRELAADILEDRPARETPSASPGGPVADGVRWLRSMQQPRIATPARWTEIIADAERLAEVWGDRLTALGWALPDVFGLDMRAESGWVGLAFDIRGGRVVLLDEGLALIRSAEGGSTKIHYKRDDPAPVIWAAAPQSETEQRG